jgi:hypothetical protein
MASTNRVFVDNELTLAEVPVGDNLVGRVKLTDGNDVALVDGNGNLWGTKSIKTVTNTVSASTDIVAAVQGKRIKVFYMKLFSASTTSNTITMQSNASTALDTSVLQAPGASMVMGLNVAVNPPSFLFATATGEKLTLAVGAAVNVTFTISYWDDDPT